MPTSTARIVNEKHKFKVRIDGIEGIEFKSCSAISMKTDEITYREGGALVPAKVPGLINFDDITLERGTSTDVEAYNWFNLVADASGGTGGTGLVSPAFKKNVVITQTRRDDTDARKWTLYGCWLKEFVGGEWDNDANEVTIERLVLAYDYGQVEVV